jgi:hypothetical protein
MHLRLDKFDILHEKLLIHRSGHALTRGSEYRSSDAFVSSESSFDTQSGSRNSDETTTNPPFTINDERSLSIPGCTEEALPPFMKTHIYTTVSVRASRYRRTRCEYWCSCSCHRVNFLRTPQTADLALGSMFIGFSGFPVNRPRCSEISCRKQSSPTLKVTYHFPPWLLARMISFSLSMTYMSGPQVSLRMPRVVGTNARVFHFAVQGDLIGMKNLFRDGLASPHDVGAGNGRTPLHVSPRSPIIYRVYMVGLISISVCSQSQSSGTITVLD